MTERRDRMTESGRDFPLRLRFRVRMTKQGGTAFLLSAISGL
ncbi:hypothetical protein THER_1951 [Thermodesulfovibrio sp. N1]|nr:hypothetical protein THER_1951 [Thermodesulfovibrio sp. N1]